MKLPEVPGSSERERCESSAPSRRDHALSWLGALTLLTLVGCSGGDGKSNDDDPGRDAGSDAGEVDAWDPTVDPLCGDGAREGGEACDDGNEEDGDGCAADCSEVEPNYACRTSGEPCVFVCGNGEFEDGEACDDGNVKAGDGCSATCKVEEGWGCARPGAACVQLPVCGNGQRERGETCDSGPLSDSGCKECAVQEGYWCTTPGQACVARVCGNGVRTPEEACDDGATKGGDGCSATCTIEPGFRCSVDGCRAICGNASLEGGETCDDGNAKSGDGCSAGCNVEPGKACPTLGMACTNAACGNGVKEGGEGCDDKNVNAADGCGPTCQLEPSVSGWPDPMVNTTCGDGLKTGQEACDDGNASSGDGCSKSCTKEDGYRCEESLQLPHSVSFRVTYRDFKGTNEPGGHPHMKQNGGKAPAGLPLDGFDPGIVGAVCNAANGASCGRLDSEGKPYLHGVHPTVTGSSGNDADAFKLWYRSTNANALAGANGPIQIHLAADTAPAGGDALVLNSVLGMDGKPTETYVFEDTSFYPLTNRGFGATADEPSNYHFTTELRYFFQYKGGETLTFYGDDDVWVFINGRLAVDIGGIHAQQYGRVVLGDDGAPSGGDSTCSVSGGAAAPTACALSAEEAADAADARFGLTKGNVYEIVLFQAERHPTGSNFKLTLAGFLAPRTYCEPICGDGIKVGWESCDDGAKNQDDAYGVCDTQCAGKAYCGDGVLQAIHEKCDNGFNLDVYSTAAGSCAPGCVAPPACGDGVVQAPYEVCDKGAANSDTQYDGCTTSCNWGPYCGDGRVDAGEDCDDGLGPRGNTSYTGEPGRCGYDCKPAFTVEVL